MAKPEGHSPDEKKALGKRLAAARALAGFKSLSDVATALTAKGYPIGRAAVGHWETGKNLPDALWLRRLAKLYGTTVDALVWDDSITIEAIRFAAQFDALNEEQKRAFKGMWLGYFAAAVSDADVEIHLPAAPMPARHQ